MRAKKKAECEGCHLTRVLTGYDRDPPPGSTWKLEEKREQQFLCNSCANIIGTETIIRGDPSNYYIGKLLLTVNSKLDLILRRGK